MPGQRFLSLDPNGRRQETAAAQTSAGAASGGQIPALNSAGMIDPTMLPTTNATMMTPTESGTAGALINVYNSGTAQAPVNSIRNADAASGKEAHGFIPAAMVAGTACQVVLREGLDAALSGLTPGVKYFLGTGGAVSATPPAAASNGILQEVGTATAAGSLSFLAGDIVTRAS